jgi:hypothetical protein
MMRAITVYKSADNAVTVHSSAEAMAVAAADPTNEALREWHEVLQIIDEV